MSAVGVNRFAIYTGTAGANTSSTNRYWIHTAIRRQCTVTPAKRPAVGGNITAICRAGYHQLRQLPSVVRSLSPYASKTLSRRANLLNRYSAAILMACDTCADMGQLQRTILIRKTFLQAFISCRLDYCNSLLQGISEGLIRRPQSVQNATPQSP